MMTSNAYKFAPSAGEVVLNAFSRLKIRGPSLSADHMHAARAEANFMQVEWSNRGPNLWDVDLLTVPLIQGKASYAVPPETVMILDAYITTSAPPTPTPPTPPVGGDFNSDFNADFSGTGTSASAPAVGSGGGDFNTDFNLDFSGAPAPTPPTPTASQGFDRVITPVSRTEYASYPNKMQQGPPTVYWFDRLLFPTITMWPVPDGNATYVLHYYRYRIIQDAVLAGGLNLEIPYLWLDAATAGLSHRLARHFAQDLEALRKADAIEAYGVAATQNTENVPLYISPSLSTYYD